MVYLSITLILRNDITIKYYSIKKKKNPELLLLILQPSPMTAFITSNNYPSRRHTLCLLQSSFLTQIRINASARYKLKVQHE